MRLMGCAYLHPDVFDVQVRGLQKFARLLQSEIIYIFYNADLDFFFEKMLETWNWHIDRCRQITDNKLLWDVVFDLFEYFLYSVIHPLLADELPKYKSWDDKFLFSKGNEFFYKTLQEYFLGEEKSSMDL